MAAFTSAPEIQDALNSAGHGDIVTVDSGIYYTSGLKIPEGVILKGQGANRTVFDAGSPAVTWTHEGNGMYSTPAYFEPSILTIDDRQVGQMDNEKMNSGTSKTFGYSGFDLMESDITLPIRTEWNGTGDFWRALYAIWGYHNGRVYLRMADKSEPKNVMITPVSEGMKIGKDSQIRDVGILRYRTAADFGGDDGVLYNCIIRGGNRRVVLKNVDRTLIDNCDISMSFYGKRPNAWQGASAEGEILYRFYKYFQGSSSSDDVSIDIKDIGEGNIISHNHIHDGAIGIRQTSASKRQSGPLIIDHNIIGYHNSVGLVWGFVNDNSDVSLNIFHNNNINIRAWRLQLDGTRVFDIHDNWHYNPKGAGGVVYGHTTNGVKRISEDITWNQYNETMVGGRDFFNWRFGNPAGARHNNQTPDLPVYGTDREMDFMGADRDYFDLSKAGQIPPGKYNGIPTDEPPKEEPPKDTPDKDAVIKRYKEKLNRIRELSRPDQPED